jgi:hypothetical protein
MDLSDRTKILILVAIIAVIIFFFLQNRNDEDGDATHNEGSLVQAPIKNITEKDIENQITREIESEERAMNKKVDFVETASESQEVPEENVNVLKKFRTRNSSKDGNFISSSYVDGKRGGGRASDLDKFFESGHPLDEKIGFDKNDPSAKDIPYANYIPGKQRKMRDVDKFNAEALLPKEKNKDWFDDPYESTSIKNTHLINIYRPIGVNTIQTTLKNSNRQIRSEFPNPKTKISPWMNSSIEPDTNIRGSSLCT